MSFREINRFRKNGELKKAYEMAKSELNESPENIWSIRAMAWVLIDLLKKLANNNYAGFNKSLKKFSELNVPLSEEMVYENLKYGISKFIFSICKLEDDAFKENKAELETFIEIIKTIDYPKPSELHSKILAAVLKKFDKINDFRSFIQWWNLENLREIDFQERTMPDDKTILPLAEQIYNAIAKTVLTGKPNPEKSSQIIDPVELDFNIERFENLAETHPEFQYVQYYLGKFYLAKGSKDKARQKFISFAKMNQSKFWIWKLLAESLTNKELKLACLCKALSFDNPDKMLVNVRKDLIFLLIDMQYYIEAITETELLSKIYEKEAWRLPHGISNIKLNSWYETEKSLKSNNELYSRYAPKAYEILFDEYPEHTAVISFVNSKKQIAGFIIDKNRTGVFPYKSFGLSPQIGDFIKMRVEEKTEHNDKFIKVLSANATSDVNTDLIKEVTDYPKILPEKKIAFIDGAIVIPTIFSKYDLSASLKVRAKAILNYDKIKGKWGWKVIEIITN